MSIDSLKQRQVIRHKETGELYKVSKRYFGIYLINLANKKTEYGYKHHQELDDFWELV